MAKERGIVERKRIHVKAKRKLGLLKKEKVKQDLEQCVLDLIDDGIDPEEAQAICEEIYGD